MTNTNESVQRQPVRGFRNTFWPTIENDDDARRVITFAYQAALFVGVITGVLALCALAGYPLLGFGGSALLDAIIISAFAYGIKKANRLAALGAAVFYSFEVVASWLGTPPRFGAMQLLFLAWFIGGYRGSRFLGRARPLREDLPSSWKTTARFVGFAFAGLACIGILLTCEWKFHNTLLGRPGYKWSTKAIPNLQIDSEDYSISLKGTDLDWRSQYDISKEGSDAKFFLVGYPGLLLAIWEDPVPDSSKVSDELALDAELGLSKQPARRIIDTIDGPPAIKGKIFVTSDGGQDEADLQMFGVFRLPKKFVTLKFVPYPPTDGSRIDKNAVLHDVKVIANSFSSRVR